MNPYIQLAEIIPQTIFIHQSSIRTNVEAQAASFAHSFGYAVYNRLHTHFSIFFLDLHTSLESEVSLFENF